MRDRTPLHFRGTERFELLALLGRGASGIVYEALDRERGGSVALKVLGEQSPQAIAHFKREFRNLQTLRHPNLVELKELIQEQGHWLLSMQLVRGVDIVAYVRGEAPVADASSLPLAAAADDDTVRAPHAPHSRTRAPSLGTGRFCETRLRLAFEQLAHGLSALHGAGLIHRDVKRSNVLVDGEGRVVVLDFGLVAHLGPQGSLLDDTFAGTPLTMAPEQAALEPLGPPGDWYAFGVVLYQALTGQGPFAGTAREILEQKRENEPVPAAAVAAGVPPDLNALASALLTRDPARRPDAQAVLACLRRARPHDILATSAPAATTTPVFVGRESELGTLDASLARVRRDECVGVVLEGESGLGKTALVHEFLTRVTRRGEPLTVFAGRCFECESLPYKALDGVVDAVCEHLRGLPEPERSRLLPPDAAEIARAFPIFHRLWQVPEFRAEPDMLDPQARRARIFAALRALFVRLAASGPGVIVLDDMQWADVDSTAMLTALLEPPGPALLWLLVRRPGVTHAALPCTSTTLRLGPLTHDESNALVDELLGARATLSPELRERVGEAQGHPFFLRELARRFTAPREHALPARLEDALWARASSLEPATRRVLELTAVAGRPVAQSVVATAFSLDGEDETSGVSAPAFAEVLDRIAALRHESLVCTSGTHPNDTVEPYHDRVREAVLARLDPSATTESHRALARALERAETGDAETLAHHWREAGDRQRAHEYTVAAADQAADAFAFERAARLYRSAVEFGAPNTARLGELEKKLGDALANAGRGFDAAEVYRSASRRSHGLTSVALDRAAAEQLLRSGHVDAGVVAMTGVLERLGIPAPRTRFTAVVSLASLRLRLRARGFGHRPRDESELSELDRARLDGAWTAATCLTMFDSVRSAELQCRTTLRALRTGTPLQVLRAHAAEGMFLALAGHGLRARIERAFASASKLATELDDPLADAWVALSRGASSFFLGEWRESEEQCTTAAAIFGERPGKSFELASARAFMVWAAMMRGRFAAVLERVPDYVTEAESRGDLYAATYQMTGFSNVVWLSRDDVAEARQRLALAESRWPSKHFDVPRYSNMIAAAHIELYAGRGAAAHARIRRDWAALRWGVAFRAQITRFGMRFVRGLAALAAYDELGDRAFLREVAACRSAIAAERVTWSECFATILAFGLCERRGDREGALRALDEAEAKAAATGMLLHRAVARHRRGEMLGGDAGRALCEDALGFMREQRIKNPPRMLDMLSPRVTQARLGVAP